MADLVLLWGIIGLIAYGAFCLSVTFRGLTETAPLELQIAFHSGRALLAVASVALLLAVSRGLVVLAQWAIK